MKKILLWLDSKSKKEIILTGIENLAKEGSASIIGTTGEFRNDIVINGQKISWLSTEEIQNQSIDHIMYFGGATFRTIAKKAEALGIEQEKLIPGSAVCIPGFSVERYRKLKASNLSIFSMNCFAGLTYHTFGLPFLSPTINMFWQPDSFLKFVSDLRSHMDMELRYYKENFEQNLKVMYPVFLLGDCEIWMNHYGDVGKDVARAKWEERRLRINWYNLLVVAATNNREWAEKFDTLPYAKKVCFTTFESDLDSAYCIESFRDLKKTITLSANDYASGKYQCYDFWEMLLYGRKVRLR